MDLIHDICNTTNIDNDFIHSAASFLHLRTAIGDVTHRFVDQIFNFTCCFSTAPCQCTHLRGNHSKTTPLLPGTCCFNCRIQRQNVGLESNAVDDANDVCNFSRRRIDCFHRLHHFRHDFAATYSNMGRRLCQFGSMSATFIVLAHSTGQLLHCRPGLFQGTGLFFCPTPQI